MFSLVSLALGFDLRSDSYSYTKDLIGTEPTIQCERQTIQDNPVHIVTKPLDESEGYTYGKVVKFHLCVAQGILESEISLKVGHN